MKYNNESEVSYKFVLIKLDLKALIKVNSQKTNY